MLAPLPNIKRQLVRQEIDGAMPRAREQLAALQKARAALAEDISEPDQPQITPVCAMMRPYSHGGMERMSVADVLFMIGLAVAALLLALLLLTMWVPGLRIWPTQGSWQSYVFWPLFRGLNVLCFMMALADRTVFLGLPVWVRAAAAIVLAASVTLFIYAFRVLGRDNSYGAQDGLVIRGIYRWTRNPQNAMLMVVYGALAITADSGPTYLLCAATIAVYFLMVLLEEPWLAGVYGEAYRRYCQRVPRFFNWRRAAIALRARLRRPRPTTHSALKARTE